MFRPDRKNYMEGELYSRLLDCDSINAAIFEAKASYQFLRERHLQVMWLEQKYFQSLSTIEGLPITIISPGIWNDGAGPDFLRAHIKIGFEEYKGDIEIHLNDEGWFHHKHHLDKNYNQVILHIAYWKPKIKLPLLTSEGRQLTCTYFEDKLTIPEARILKLIDLDLYPYKHFVGSGACAHVLFRNLPSKNILHFFRQAAAWRLGQKYQNLQAKIDRSSDLLKGGMAMVLGYKHNAEAFLQLFFMLQQQPLMDELSLLAYAMGLCGFFNEKFRLQWLQSLKYQSLAWRYDAMPSLLKEKTITLNLSRTRPANHPVRRLAILVKMMLDPDLIHVLEGLNTLWQKHWPTTARQTWPLLREAFIEALPAYQDPYWESHYIFENEGKQYGIALLGRDLKYEILVNICLPLLFHDINERNNLLEQEAFFNFYATFPASKTGKATYLMHRFFGDTQKKKLFKKAYLQQGAYQLHRDFCTHYEASCVGCPFIERYKAMTSPEIYPKNDSTILAISLGKSMG